MLWGPTPAETYSGAVSTGTLTIFGAYDSRDRCEDERQRFGPGLSSDKPRGVVAASLTCLPTPWTRSRDVLRGGNPDNNAFVLNRVDDFEASAADVVVGPGALNTRIVGAGTVEDHGTGTTIVRLPRPGERDDDHKDR